jgi:pyruvate/2-oxoglutarate dehydrogenase complex dihydrolipoamide acyltransferase (E2) component
VKRLSGWRRIADAMWQPPDDPQVYGTLEVDATAIQAHLASVRQRGEHCTVTHVVGKALAHAIAAVPDINVRLVGGYAIPRRSVDVFFITAVEGGRDLSGVKIENADRKPLTEIAKELTARATRQKSGEDPDLARSKRSMQLLPKAVLRRALRVSAFLAGDLAKSLEPLGLKDTPFGSAMVTSVGMFGLPMGFAPISWMYKVPILILVGEITDKPVVESGAVVIRPMLPICATIDHRYADGWHISKLLVPFKAYLADPAAFEG